MLVRILHEASDDPLGVRPMLERVGTAQGFRQQLAARTQAPDPQWLILMQPFLVGARQMGMCPGGCRGPAFSWGDGRLPLAGWFGASGDGPFARLRMPSGAGGPVPGEVLRTGLAGRRLEMRWRGQTDTFFFPPQPDGAYAFYWHRALLDQGRLNTSVARHNVENRLTKKLISRLARAETMKAVKKALVTEVSELDEALEAEPE